jgi:hypothetical protein
MSRADIPLDWLLLGDVGALISGELPVGPTTSKGLSPVGQPLKALACVQVLTKRRLSSFSTMWNFAGNFGL